MLSKSLLGLALCLATVQAWGAEGGAVAKVGHMCCGSCTASAEAAVKALPWVASARATAGANPTVEVTAKPGTSVDAKALSDRLTKAGFSPTEMTVKAEDGTVVKTEAGLQGPDITLDAGPQTAIVATVGHMCCGGCAGALKAAAAKFPSRGAPQVDQTAKTVTVLPKPGKVSLSSLLASLHAAGFQPLKVAVKG